jgi:hypothetical protein
MPLLSPRQIRSVLAETGTAKDQNEISKLLEQNSIGPDSLIEELGSTIRGADSTAMKLRGIELGLKLNKLLGTNEDGPSAPVVNIIINDAMFTENPILIPRS